ncbi:malate synthase A [Haliangium ochraceum]|uniref:Malate synthase n=1 Tax=Haliangium ochraceum (strain DSM 14365 / JCM 11303 / SMP-2) TaxID=502025 RepID=D0LQ97_HALO1|nr:malate synthase A [Haliangium ochraceum]ACY18906.1 malate synthase A [Haliangium ochraceum DSM 14365]
MSSTPQTEASSGLQVTGSLSDRYAELLTPEALGFVESLARAFEERRRALLASRRERQARLDAGERPSFVTELESAPDAETRAQFSSAWTVAPIRPDLLDRRVEITGPTDRKMVINALNSGANVFMADLEDSSSPTWDNAIQGQINLFDAVRRTISFTNPAGKQYALNESIATLMVRPRGWHLDEKHLLLDGQPMSASLVDFGLYFFHNARELIDRGTGPYFYLPKLESHLEARLWNDVFVLAQDRLGIPHGTIRATVLIETILAAFEMDAILFELRQHSAGLNCGRWDYIFSIIKKFRADPGFVMPDRAQVTMTSHAMHSYSLLAIQTCHRRGAHAIGGMAAQIPVKGDPEANERALGKVRDDKEREARDGHDGTWVAHPGLVELARKAFDAHMEGPHQIQRKREDVTITADDLLTVPEGSITEKGLRHNLDVGIRYLGAWLAGTGCVPIYNLMEDAATAEISRAQVWQWVHHDSAKLSDGRPITAEMVRAWTREELERIRADLGDTAFAQARYEQAAAMIEDIATRPQLDDFMTSVAYDQLD